MPEKSPIQCALDQGKLDNIEATQAMTHSMVVEISGKIDALTGWEGPLADHENRINEVEKSDRRAHGRIDTVETKQQTDHDTITRWVAKAITATAAVLVAIGAVIKYVLP